MHTACPGQQSACFNCLDELDPDGKEVVDEVMSIVNALVPDEGGVATRNSSTTAPALFCLG
jgi:type IV secretory pathway TraG/TraD family ATPase VirD4